MTGREKQRKTAETGELWFRPVPDAPRPQAVRGGRAVPAVRALIALLAVGGLALFGGLIWVLYARGEAAGVPVLVRAPDGPVKVRPADRGGMEVPYRDKLVFNRITGESAHEPVRLRPSADAPVLRPEVPRLEPASPPPLEVIGNREITVAAVGQTGASREGMAAGELGSTRWAIQVAAFRQRRYAVAWMVETTRKHDDVFGSLDSAVVDGMTNMMRYYRVRFGPFPDQAAAEAKCAEVRGVGLNCITVAPEES